MGKDGERAYRSTSSPLSFSMLGEVGEESGGSFAFF